MQVRRKKSWRSTTAQAPSKVPVGKSEDGRTSAKMSARHSTKIYQHDAHLCSSCASRKNEFWYRFLNEICLRQLTYGSQAVPKLTGCSDCCCCWNKLPTNHAGCTQSTPNSFLTPILWKAVGCRLTIPKNLSKQWSHLCKLLSWSWNNLHSWDGGAGWGYLYNSSTILHVTLSLISRRFQC